MRYILAHPTLVLKLAVTSDYVLHHAFGKLVEAMVLVLGGI